MTPFSFVTGARILGSLSLLSLPATSIFYPDYGGSFFLRNVDNQILGYKESFRAAVVSIRKDNTEEASI